MRKFNEIVKSVMRESRYGLTGLFKKPEKKETDGTTTLKFDPSNAPEFVRQLVDYGFICARIASIEGYDADRFPVVVCFKNAEAKAKWVKNHPTNNLIPYPAIFEGGHDIQNCFICPVDDEELLYLSTPNSNWVDAMGYEFAEISTPSVISSESGNDNTTGKEYLEVTSHYGRESCPAIESPIDVIERVDMEEIRIEEGSDDDDDDADDSALPDALPHIFY